MSFGENIKKYRTKLNLTQEQLGEKIGISAQAVSKWENSETLPDTAILPDIADALGASLDELFDHEVSDNGHLYRHIEKYIQCKDRTAWESRLFDLISSAYRSYMTEDPTPSLAPQMWRTSEDPELNAMFEVAHKSLLFTNDRACGMLYESNKFPFAAMLLEPENGYSEIVDDPDMQNFLFAVGDPDCFKCIRYLLTKDEFFAIEASLLLKQSGADESRLTEVIEKLWNATIIWVDDVTIDGKPRRIVKCLAWRLGIALLPFFASAYSFRRMLMACKRSSGMRTKPILTE